MLLTILIKHSIKCESYQVSDHFRRSMQVVLRTIFLWTSCTNQLDDLRRGRRLALTQRSRVFHIYRRSFIVNVDTVLRVLLNLELVHRPEPVPTTSTISTRSSERRIRSIGGGREERLDQLSSKGTSLSTYRQTTYICQLKSITHRQDVLVS